MFNKIFTGLSTASRLARAIVELGSRLDSREEAMQATVAELRKDIRSLKSDVSQLAADVEKLTSEHLRLRGRFYKARGALGDEEPAGDTRDSRRAAAFRTLGIDPRVPKRIQEQ